jgi:hypothetical protein
VRVWLVRVWPARAWLVKEISEIYSWCSSELRRRRYAPRDNGLARGPAYQE